MRDDDLSALIQERRRKAECEAAGLVYIPDAILQRKTNHCDPDEAGNPDVLIGPNTAPDADDEDALLPPPLVISSPELTLDCVSGNGSVTIAAGASVVDLFLDEVSNLTRSELYRIYPVVSSIQAVIDDNLEALIADSVTAQAFDAAIIAVSKMEPVAAAALREKAVSLRGGPATDDAPATGLYAIAELTAAATLVCVFNSRQVWTVCDDQSPTGYTTYYVAPNPLPTNTDSYQFRPAGFAASTTSQEDADLQAEIDAASALSCVYLNEEITVNCADTDNRFDHVYDPPFTVGGTPYTTLHELGEFRTFASISDTAAVTKAGFSSYAIDALVVRRHLVTEVTLAAGNFPSATQAAANAKASEWAEAQLNCFFPSREREVNCSNRPMDNNPVTDRMLAMGYSEAEVFAEMDSDYAIDPALVTNVSLLGVEENNVSIDSSTGLVVTLPAGLVSSFDGAVAAEDEAIAYAQNFLDCRWLSPATECSCADLWTPEELARFNVTISDTSSDALTFDKGLLGSSETGPVPNVVDLCRASLNCVYCNQTQEPRCHIAYDNGIPYDLWNPQTDESLPIAITTNIGVSSGITAGLPAGVICDSDPRLVQTLSEATSTLPPLINNQAGQPVCKYGNREITRTCADKVGEWAYGLTPDSKDRFMTVSAGSFEADTQIEADNLAEAFLNAALVCEFGSPPIAVLCGARPYIEPAVPGEYDQMTFYGTGENVSHSAIGGLETPVIAPAHTFTSLESPANARAQAMLALIAQLDCFWQSARIDLLCGAMPVCPTEQRDKTEDERIIEGSNFGNCCSDSRGSSLGEVFIEARAVTSYVSQADANVQAYSMAYAELDCFWQSARIDLQCGAPPVCPLGQRKQREFEFIDEGRNEHKCCPDSKGDVAGEVFLDEKTIVSYTSQEDANVQAYSMAYAELDCFWQSARIDLQCGAPPVCPAGQREKREYEIITEGTNEHDCCPDSKGDLPGEVFLEAKSVVSYIGQAEANVQAYSLAYADLDCFWQSARIDLLCGAPPVCPLGKREFDETQVIEEGTNEHDCCPDSVGDVPGEAFLEAKSIISYINQADANVQAYSIAAALLDCFWQSARVDLRCTAPAKMPSQYDDLDEEGNIREGDIFLDPPREPNGRSRFCPDSNGSEWGEVFLGAKSVVSYVSQKDANLTAYGIAWVELDCFFQSAQMILSCTPPRHLQPSETILNETNTISYGSDGDSMISEAKAVVSYYNQADANNQAFAITRGQLGCDGGKDHVFGVSGRGTPACCKVSMSQKLIDSGLSKFYSPLDGGSGLEGLPVPGFVEMPVDCSKAEVCGEFPAYFYLEVIPQDRQSGPLHARHFTTANPEVKVYSSEQPLVEGSPGAHNVVRRLIAYANQDDPKSSFDRGAKDDCADLKIVQAVTSAQRLSSIESYGVVIPVIVDLDSYVEARHFKPHSFALTRLGDSAAIYYGALVTTVSRINFEHLKINGREINSLLMQPSIPSVQVHSPNNLSTPDGYLSPVALGWFGDVYLSWEVDMDGTVVSCQVVGPEEPEGAQIPFLNNKLHREALAGNAKYYVKIGSVAAPESGGYNGIVQLVSSDVHWSITIVPEGGGADESSSSSSSSGSSSGGGGSSSGSDKSTAIVPAPWSPYGYTALFTKESPEVLFDDVVTVCVAADSERTVLLDHRYVYVCDPGTIKSVSAAPDQPVLVGVKVIGGDKLQITVVGGRGDVNVNVLLSGIRRGFSGMRFPYRDREQFDANERTLNSAYPAKTLK